MEKYNNKMILDKCIKIISKLNTKTNAEIFLRTSLSNIKIKEFCYDQFDTTNENELYSIFVTTLNKENYKIKISSGNKVLYEISLSVKTFNKIRKNLIKEAKELIK